jgi:hypothetical protein
LDIHISTLELAVANALSLLTRTRVTKGGPFYLLKPGSGLEVLIKDISNTDGIRQAVAAVRCKTWGDGTVLALELCEHEGLWLPWGSFTIAYGQSYPVASLFGRCLDSKALYPMYASNPNAARHLELRIRQRAS